MNTRADVTPIIAPGNHVPALLCFIGAMIEGFDISSAGLTAHKFADHFGLDHTGLGIAFSASTTGMFIGALAGGWLADRIGRKAMLSASFALIGVMTIATAVAPSTSIFLLCRLLAGIGIGSGVVGLLAMAAALGSESRRTIRVTLLFSGISFGGMTVSILAAVLQPDYDWRFIFFVGGAVPLIISAFFVLKLPSIKLHKEGDGATPIKLFTEGRAIKTICLWVMCFMTLLTLHLMLNWLPSLVIGFDRSPRIASLVNATFSFGGGISGAILAWLIMRIRIQTIFVLCYSGIIAGMLITIAFGAYLPILFLGGLMMGFCLNGAQFLVYGVGTSVYEANILGTGMGFASGVGRLGAMSGPMVGALALALGGGTATVLTSTIPVIGAALTAAVVLTSNKRRKTSD